MLKFGERIVASESVEEVGSGGRRSGILHLTNQRVVFEYHEVGGVFSAGRVLTTLDAPLNSIRNVAPVAQLIGTPKLHIEFYRDARTFKVGDPGRWANLIQSVHQEMPPPPPPPVSPPPTFSHSASSPGTVVVHVASPASPPPPPPVVMFPCPYCRKPQPSHVTSCGSCGAPLRSF